jgi:hemolysin III
LFVKGHDNVTTMAYVGLGWLPMLGIKPIVEVLPTAGLAWLLGGGVLYTLGTYFLTHDHLKPYYHAIWHLMVIAASACHFAGVMFVVVPDCRT